LLLQTLQYLVLGKKSLTKRVLQVVLIARWQSRLGCIKQIDLPFCCVRVFNGESVLSFIPNNKISGGKVLSHNLPKGSSRLKLALRNAANAIGQLKEGHLNAFFRKINYKKGRATAVSALARKLAVIIWNMVTKGLAYQPPAQYLCLDEKRKLGLVKRIRKQIDKFALTNADLGFVIS
jgi:hypothetical protein